MTTTLAQLVANARLKDTLDGAGGRPSPIGPPAKEINLGTLLAEIQTRLLALEAETGAGGTLTVDAIDEETAAAGVTIDGVLLKDGEVTTDTINEDTATAGVTIDGALLKDGLLQNDQIGIAVITAVGGSGGATAGTFSVQVNKPDESTAFGKTVQVYIQVDDTQYTADANANVTFATATSGTIVATAAGWALVETDPTGLFECALASSSDETVYFSARTPEHGLSDPTDHALIVSNSASATWAA